MAINEASCPISYPLTRRAFLANAAKLASGVAVTGALGGLLSACSSAKGSVASSAGALAHINIQLLWTEDVEFGGELAMDSQGYAKKLGFIQHLIPGGPEVNSIQAVAGGSAPIGLIGANNNIAQARDTGIPIKAIAVTFQKLPSGLLSLASKPIKTPHDAIGKRIGLQAGARPDWAEILAVNKIPESSMTIVPVGVDPSVLVTGQVDGYWSYAFDQPLILKAQGIDTYMMLSGDAGVPGYGDVIFATETALANQEALLVRWLRGAIMGWKYFIENPATVASYTVHRSPSLNLVESEQIAEARAQVPYLESTLTKQKGLLWFDPAVFTQGAQLMYETGQLKSVPTASEMVDTSILAKAYAGATSL